jgi:hypothetical protein
MSHFISYSSTEPKCIEINEVLQTSNQTDKKTLKLDFPITPNTSTEILPFEGHSVNLTMYVASDDSDIYLMFELELGKLKDEVTQDSYGFFAGFLTYIINDLGAQLGPLTEFQFEEFKGFNFDIISPNEDEKRSAKGKSLLVNERAYIWFGISSATDSNKKINDFINSYSLN